MPFPGAASDLGKAFGFTFHNGYAFESIDGKPSGRVTFSKEDHSLASHSVTTGRNVSERVERVVTFTGQAFQIPEKAVSLLTFNDRFDVLFPDTAWVFDTYTKHIPAKGLSQGAVLDYHKGRVAVFGEAAMFSGQLSGQEKKPMGLNDPEAKQNLPFLLNLIHWLDPKIEAQNESLTVKEFAKKLYQAEHPQILDARSPEEYSLNHIRGAVNINLADSIELKKAIARLNPDTPTFTYSINSGRGSILAAKLQALGFRHVYALPGGLAGWVGSGYTLETFGKKESVLTGEQLKQLIQSNELALVDFGSNYCGGCLQLIPVLDSLENTYFDTVKIIRIKLEENPGLIKEQKTLNPQAKKLLVSDRV
jgi:rhodanese-related sulfurtransferase